MDRERYEADIIRRYGTFEAYKLVVEGHVHAGTCAYAGMTSNMVSGFVRIVISGELDAAETTGFVKCIQCGRILSVPHAIGVSLLSLAAHRNRCALD